MAGAALSQAEGATYVSTGLASKPLLTLPSVARKTYYTTPSQPLPITYQSHDDHWAMVGIPLQIPPKTEHRVIRHLRKQLVNRMAVRLKEMQEVKPPDPIDDAKTETKITKKRLASRKGKRTVSEGERRLRSRRRKRFFGMYTEMGSRLGRASIEESDIVSHDENETAPNAVSNAITVLNEYDEVADDSVFSHPGENTEKRLQSPKAQQPPITRENSRLPELPKTPLRSVSFVKGAKSDGGDVKPKDDGVTEDNSVPAASLPAVSIEPNEDVMRLLAREPTMIASYRDVVVSPVSTPSASRPATQFGGGRVRSRGGSAVRHEQMDYIMRGNVDETVEVPDRTFRVYLSSAITDFTEERTTLLRRVFQQLREVCARRECDLRVYDPHWGFPDTASNEHTDLTVCRRLLTRCHSAVAGNGKHISYVCFLGDKCGLPVASPTLSIDTFDRIHAAVLAEYRQVQAMLQEIREREAAEEEARRAAVAAEEARKAATRRRRASDESSHGADDDGDGFDAAPTSTSPLDIVASAAAPPVVAARRGFGAGRVGAVRTFGAVAQSIGKAMTTYKSKAPLNMEDVMEHDPGLLTTWYRRDENAIPPVYKLQPISAHYKDILSLDKAKRRIARTQWIETERKLMKTMTKYAHKCDLEETVCKQLRMSPFENEVREGFLTEPVNNDTSLFLLRTFEDLRDTLGDEKASLYVDLEPNKPVINNDAGYQLGKMKMEVHEKIASHNQLRYEINWHPEGICPTKMRQHVSYLNQLCDDVAKKLEASLLRAMPRAGVGGAGDATERDRTRQAAGTEVAHHINFCHEKARQFYGRRHLLEQVKTYVRSGCLLPLIIHGTAGSGKTTLLAKCVRKFRQWGRRSEVSSAYIVRMIGVTGDSVNIRKVLRIICLQLCDIFGSSSRAVPHDYNGLVNDFNARICQASERKPLYILIDAVNQLSSEYNAHTCGWLPKRLPKNVKLIITTRNDGIVDTMTALRKLYPTTDECFLEMDSLTLLEAQQVLRHRLRLSSRALSDSQTAAFEEAFSRCPEPLFLQLLIADILTWSSDYTPSEFPETMKSFVTQLFTRLERKYGDVLVRRILGFLTCSQHGLTENELEDILSTDALTMDDLSAQYGLPVRRFPTKLMLHMWNDLDGFLTEVPTAGVRTVTWAYELFREVATERYLLQRDKAPSYHKVAGEYFMGSATKSHGESSKSRSQSDVDLLVSTQPLYFESVDTSGRRVAYNHRKLTELPTHLIKSQQSVLVKQQCLCNFNWLSTKLRAMSLGDILDDFRAYLAIEGDDADAKLLSSTLFLSSTVLNKEPTELATQLLGRLTDLIAQDKPKAPQDPLKYPLVHPLLTSAKNSMNLTLVPSKSCMTLPSDVLFDVLNGHTAPITAVTMNVEGTEAFTAAQDDTIKFWDLRTERVTGIIYSAGRDVCQLITALDDTMLISSEIRCIRAWSVRNKSCVYTFDGICDTASISTARGGQILVACLDGVGSILAWNLKQMHQVLNFHVEERGVHQDKTIATSGYSETDMLVYGVRGGNFGAALNVATGKVVYPKLRCSLPGVSITAAAITRDYFILANRGLSQHPPIQELYYLDLFDTSNGKPVRRIKGCAHDNFDHIMITNVQSHAVTLNANKKTKATDISVWNLETEEHKHMGQHARISTMGALFDFRCVLCASPEENTVLKWNVQQMNQMPSTKLEGETGITELRHLSSDRYVLSRCGGTCLTVWDLQRKNFSGQTVSKYDTLIAAKDTVLVDDNKLIILGNSAYSPVVEESRFVFQTITIFNLLTMRVEIRLKDVFIIPCPDHEFQILEGDKLLGLSENRSHFIIWSLLSGQVTRRLRSNFRDKERSQLPTIGNVSHREESFIEAFRLQRDTTKMMTPWDRRNESASARKMRRDGERKEAKRDLDTYLNEKNNPIHTFLISADKTTIVASYYAHHMCVFDMVNFQHTVTLTSDHMLLHLNIAALTHNGAYLAHGNYDDDAKTTYLALWNCREGRLEKRLREERGTAAIAISDTGDMVVFGKENGEIRIWRPQTVGSLKKMHGYKGLHFISDGTSSIRLLDQDRKALAFAENSLSIWDLVVGQLISVFSPDVQIQCFTPALREQLFVVGMKQMNEPIILRLMSANSAKIAKAEESLFQTTSESDSDDGDIDYIGNGE